MLKAAFLFCFNLQVYCLMKEGQGWTLIARISNRGGKRWKLDSSWWKDIEDGKREEKDSKDMISPGFWLVGGNEFMITRSDDPYTALLQTTDDCLNEQTFRNKIHTRNGAHHSGDFIDNQCVSSCNVTYGGKYRATDGFKQANINGCSPLNLQTGNKIGFWCKYANRGHSNWAVMMIGSGGDKCSEADHGIGIGAKRLKNDGEKHSDFGDKVDGPHTEDYYLNLWVR